MQRRKSIFLFLFATIARLCEDSVWWWWLGRESSDLVCVGLLCFKHSPVQDLLNLGRGKANVRTEALNILPEIRKAVEHRQRRNKLVFFIPSVSASHGRTAAQT